MPISKKKSKQDIKQEILLNYIKPSHPIAFSGINNIYNFYNGKLSKREILNILSRFNSYTLHREAKKLQRNPYFVHKKRHQFQIDLIDIQQLSKYNNNVKYLFTCIDIFTKYAWIIPLKNKTAKFTLDAFKKIISNLKQKPLTLVSDRGAEIENKIFRTYCKDQQIKLKHNYNFIHAAFIERFNKTIQRKIYSYLTQFETKKYINVLQKLLISYNTSIHRMIKCTPKSAELEKNQLFVRKNLHKYYSKFKRKKPSLNIGDTVRISLAKTKFTRGYEEQFKEEIFKIKEIHKNLPIPTYTLCEFDDENEIIEGRFYEFELVPATNEIFAIEKIIKKKSINGINMLLVKWRGYKKTDWIPEKDIIKIK